MKYSIVFSYLWMDVTVIITTIIYSAKAFPTVTTAAVVRTKSHIGKIATTSLPSSSWSTTTTHSVRHIFPSTKRKSWCMTRTFISKNDTTTTDDSAGASTSRFFLLSTQSIRRQLSSVRSFASQHFFLLGMLATVALANLAPSWGRNGSMLHPERFIGNYGVSFIFLLTGLSLELSQFTRAMTNLPLNMLIQAILFLAWPIGVGVPLSRVVLRNVLPRPLLDGILITTCLPTTVNMCVILTAAANGNVAAAVCNAVTSNMVGIFATPALVFHFCGSSNQIQLPFLDMLLKLSQKVLLPVGIGQALRCTTLKHLYEKNSKLFKRLQEVILLGILWNAFCTAISANSGLDWRHALALCLAILPTMHLAVLAVLFVSFSKLGFDRRDVVAAMFCASHKTLAFGLPLINTIFESSPNLASYTAPLMFLHPIQLILGSILIPRLETFTADHQQQKET